MDFRKFEKLFSALSSPLRLQMILLMAKRPFCVCELEKLFEVTQPAISQNIRILKDAGLLNERREKQWIFYSTNKEMLKSLIEEILQLLEKEENFIEIAGLKISDLPDDPQRSCEMLSKRSLKE
ncbi:MAG: ArsR family transcriptional regulator [Mesoaciditoga sp.]|uniref:ArsR/SmtB family transcription factor n=1 Tax=Athalassotoga sp. TaxID=2022597 RepID=UPI000CC89DCD|nr:MAG: ArsR family transcriptional regulator [Mesoaciditoga sp.]PMP79057.1 MAG: ArsR family transcriptional regulator [Mesoaciditoga sp.]HEU24481.1 ArsR family transcriptional regulator [Mesoaciditoga lauensis]